MGEPDSYVFDRAEGLEDRRLEDQARLFDPLTERLFREAGIAEGMRVLDLGSGAGDVAMLAARLVGSRGSVVGVEASQESIDTARRRIREAGHGNVAFFQGDIQDLDAVLDPDEASFDAVVGRLILAFASDPGKTLGAAAAWVRPGGLVCFQECDSLYEWAIPTSPLWGRVRDWFVHAMRGADLEPRMGLRLYSAFLSAGLPAPTMRLEAPIGGAAQSPAVIWAGVIRGVLPAVRQLGIASDDDADPRTLLTRLTEETHAADGVVIGPPMIGAWSRTPDVQAT
jgi:SAM-dependent methyltransferase